MKSEAILFRFVPDHFAASRLSFILFHNKNCFQWNSVVASGHIKAITRCENQQRQSRQKQWRCECNKHRHRHTHTKINSLRFPKKSDLVNDFHSVKFHADHSENFICASLQFVARTPLKWYAVVVVDSITWNVQQNRNWKTTAKLSWTYFGFRWSLCCRFSFVVVVVVVVDWVQRLPLNHWCGSVSIGRSHKSKNVQFYVQ